MSDESDQFERQFARRMAEFSETPLPGQYSVDEVVAQSASQRRSRSTMLLLAATMAAVVLVGAGLAAASRLGRDPGVGDTGLLESRAPVIGGAACNPAPFVQQLRVVVYDYEPANSPQDLAAQADLVVSGAIVSVDAITPQGRDRVAESLMAIEVDEVLRGNAELVLGGRVHVSVPGDAAAMNSADVAGCKVVLFLDDRGTGSAEGLPQGAHTFSPFVQGLWIESGSGMMGAYADLDNSPPGWDGIVTIGDLVSATADQYTTSIAKGLTPEMTADEVASFVSALLTSTKEGNAPRFDDVTIDIISVDAMTLAEAMSRNDAEVGQGGDQLVWLVTADGPFLSSRGLGPDPRVGISGYYVIGDATGDIIGIGFSMDR